MKNIQFFLAFVLMMTITSCRQQNKSAETISTTETEQTLVIYKMDVKGMTCTGCENTVKKSVSQLDGVADISASHTDSSATVKFDTSKTSLDAISLAIQEKGYSVTGSEKIASE